MTPATSGTGDAQPYKRKLIEVAIPLKELSAASKAYKDRKTGSIRNLHKWFAPMPAPAWRVLLAAALLDDPVDPAEREQVVRLLKQLVPADGGLPKASALRSVRSLLSSERDLPVVLDPFTGGGSTLVEAQRLGFRVVGSDLNPVPALISKFLAEIAPKAAGKRAIHESGALLDEATAFSGLKSDIIHYAEIVQQRVWRQVGSLYSSSRFPVDPVCWIWAHSVVCPNPACGKQVPMISSTTLRAGGQGCWIRFEASDDVVQVHIVEDESKASTPTRVAAGKFECPSCGTLLDAKYIRAEASNGKLAEMPLCAVIEHPDRGREFVAAKDILESFQQPSPPDDLADLELPEKALGFRIQGYGFKYYADIFNARQQTVLLAFAKEVCAIHEEVCKDSGDTEYALAVTTLLGLSIGKLAQTNCKHVRWRLDSRSGNGMAEAAFSRQTINMIWDYAENNPFMGSAGGWITQVRSAMRALDYLPAQPLVGEVKMMDARHAHNVVAPNSALVATDPPYFDAIGYADLSDFFYLWHRVALADVLPDLYQTVAAPRSGELIADPSKWGGSRDKAYEYFVKGFTDTFRSLKVASRDDLPILVVYAHKQTESKTAGGAAGWEALLQSLIDADLLITGTWPIHGTGSTRHRILSSNALASYIVLVCRSASPHRSVADRRVYLRRLRDELPSAIQALQQVNIMPSDLSQAAIGPGMAIFTSYSSVFEPDGSRMTVGTALDLINQVLDEILGFQTGDFDADTRWCIRWFETYQFQPGPFPQADQIARSLNTSVEGLQRAGVVRSGAGRVSLLKPSELPTEYEPAKDLRLNVWEAALHLSKRLEEHGIDAAGHLLARIAPLIDLDAIKSLAYLLYSVCDDKGWQDTALVFNSLVTSWSDIDAASRSATVTREQGELMFTFDED